MNAVSNNATRPTPAIAPGAEAIDVQRAAEELASRWPEGGVDPRIRAIVPGFDAPFFQAGLAGYSDAAMRIIARRHGCPFCVTEALLDRTLLAGGRGFTKADLGELHENIPGGPDDHPLACQIMGSEPGEMAAAALKAAEQGRRGDKAYRLLAYSSDRSPDADGAPEVLDASEGLGDCEDETCETLIDEINSIRDEPDDDGALASARGGRGDGGGLLAFEVIDVNLACPVKKVRSKARGGHWLADARGAIRILEAVREAVPAAIPCTVKLRRSYDDTPEMAANFERIFEAAHRIGYAWATVHARTVEQKYIGPSRWTFLRDLVRRHPHAIVLGSGDIWEVGDIFRMIKYTGVAGVSVARGCIGNPWIFRQGRDLLAGREPLPPTIAEQRAVLEEHFRLCVRVHRGTGPRGEARSELLAGKLMRKFGIRFAMHHPRGEDVRRRFIAVTNVSDWAAVLNDYYAS